MIQTFDVLAETVATLYGKSPTEAENFLKTICSRLRVDRERGDCTDLERLLSVLRTDALARGLPPALVRARLSPLQQRVEVLFRESAAMAHGVQKQ